MATTKAAAAATGAGSTGLPKTGAISKGYNFASTWEQVSYPFCSLINFFIVLFFPIFSLFWSKAQQKIETLRFSKNGERAL